MSDSKREKKFKDPIYGYISIPELYVKDIVDSASFQRLRRIIQTSYAPLFSSALHNRFVHSIGVYHLGRIASEALCKNLNEFRPRNFRITEANIFKLKETFQIACLLHDVGHAPFSHTGERYYKDDNGGIRHLHALLEEEIGVEKLNFDRPESESAAPHEIVSAIVGIREFGNEFLGQKEDREFFARCITGYRYEECSDINRVKNVFISLLNSSFIDVDKLDYLLRDAYTTGYDTVSIDYQRLLSSVMMVRLKDQSLVLAFQKRAVSEIENVIYARDSEKKWIQTHPVIQYESYLINHVVESLRQHFPNKRNRKALFSIDSLKENRKNSKKNNWFEISLLCDDDIVFLAKNVYPTLYINEYFNRGLRRHPVWKSEAEYRAYFINEGNNVPAIRSAIAELAEFCIKNTNSILDGASLERIRQEAVRAKENQELKSLDFDLYQQQLDSKMNMTAIAEALSVFSTKEGIPLDYLFIGEEVFNSGFAKRNFSDLMIAFNPEHEKTARIVPFSKVVTTYNNSSDNCYRKHGAKHSNKENIKKSFYYLYYRRPLDNPDLIIRCGELYQIMEERLKLLKH